jgi:hypothetical protein
LWKPKGTLAIRNSNSIPTKRGLMKVLILVSNILLWNQVGRKIL